MISGNWGDNLLDIERFWRICEAVIGTAMLFICIPGVYLGIVYQEYIWLRMLYAGTRSQYINVGTTIDVCGNRL